MGDLDLERSASGGADEIYEVECALANARATPRDAACAAHDMFEYAVGTGLDSDDYMDEYVQYFSCTYMYIYIYIYMFDGNLNTVWDLLFRKR